MVTAVTHVPAFRSHTTLPYAQRAHLPRPLYAVSSTRFAAKKPKKAPHKRLFDWIATRSPVSLRTMFYGTSIGGLSLTEIMARYGDMPNARWAFIPLTLFTLVGLHDRFFSKDAIHRNAPGFGWLRILGHDHLGPMGHQYVVQGPEDGLPVKKHDRAQIRSMAHGDNGIIPLGTKKDVYAPGFQYIPHTHDPADMPNPYPRIRIGENNPECTQPYDANIFHISGMSYGSVGERFIEACNIGAKQAGILHNTGEGGCTKYHLKHGGDLIWQIGTGYFGCRTLDGQFDETKFAEKANHPNVKMIELKMSQGAKPGDGGYLPAHKVTEEIAEERGIEPWKACKSPDKHTAFDENSPVGMLKFIQKLRRLANGKPVGFKMCIGQKHEFMAIIKAMQETGIYPDFIAIDGAEGGTGAAPKELADHMGTPLTDALVFAHNALVGANMRDKTKIIAGGGIFDSYHLVRALAMGADMGYSARGVMVASGCILMDKCDTGGCLPGITTTDAGLQSGFDIKTNSGYIAQRFESAIERFYKLITRAGLSRPDELEPWMIKERVSRTEVQDLYDLYGYIEPGSIVNADQGDIPSAYEKSWKAADPHSWKPKQGVRF